MADKTLVKATNIHMQFTVGDETVTPLKDVSFELTDNSFNIIYGPSGSGKSTLLNVLTGLQKPSSGKVLFDDKDVYNLPSDELARFRATRIGIVYQTNYWVKSLSVADNVAMPLYFMGYSRSKANKLVQEALEQVNMGAYIKKYPVMLSGGEQQRIAVARAIVNSPLFVIADEPTGSLDSKNGDMVMNLLRDCQDVYKRTVILVTHNMEYLPLADHLLRIEDGDVKLMKSDSIREATAALFEDMRQRIERLSKTKENHATEK